VFFSFYSPPLTLFLGQPARPTTSGVLGGPSIKQRPFLNAEAV